MSTVDTSTAVAAFQHDLGVARSSGQISAAQFEALAAQYRDLPPAAASAIDTWLAQADAPLATRLAALRQPDQALTRPFQLTLADTQSVYNGGATTAFTSPGVEAHGPDGAPLKLKTYQQDHFMVLNTDAYLKASGVTSIDGAAMHAIMDQLDRSTAHVAGASTAAMAAISPGTAPGEFNITWGARGDSMTTLVVINTRTGAVKARSPVMSLSNGLDNPTVNAFGGFGSDGNEAARDMVPFVKPTGDVMHDSTLLTENDVRTDVLRLSPDERAYVIVASDGLRDGYKAEHARQTGPGPLAGNLEETFTGALGADVAKFVRDNPQGDVSRFLTERAMALGSIDNVTVVATRLDATSKPLPSLTGVFDSPDEAGVKVLSAIDRSLPRIVGPQLAPIASRELPNILERGAATGAHVGGVSPIHGLLGLAIGATVGAALAPKADAATIADGALRGAADAAIPGVSDGFKGLVPGKQRTADTVLNTLDTLTGATAFAATLAAPVSSGASLPVAAVASVANLGVQAARDVAYVTGLSDEGGLGTAVVHGVQDVSYRHTRDDFFRSVPAMVPDNASPELKQLAELRRLYASAYATYDRQNGIPYSRPNTLPPGTTVADLRKRADSVARIQTDITMRFNALYDQYASADGVTLSALQRELAGISS